MPRPIDYAQAASEATAQTRPCIALVVLCSVCGFYCRGKSRVAHLFRTPTSFYSRLSAKTKQLQTPVHGKQLLQELMQGPTFVLASDPTICTERIHAHFTWQTKRPDGQTFSSLAHLFGIGFERQALLLLASDMVHSAMFFEYRRDGERN